MENPPAPAPDTDPRGSPPVARRAGRGRLRQLPATAAAPAATAAAPATVPRPRPEQIPTVDPDEGLGQVRAALELPPPRAVRAACAIVERVLEHDPGAADRLVTLVLDRLGDTEPLPNKAYAYRTASRTAYRVGDYDRAAEHARRLLRLGERAGDPLTLGWGQACLAYVEYEHGRYGHALDLGLQALARFRHCPDEQDGQARMLVLAGVTHCRLGMHGTGLTLFREAREIFRMLGDTLWVQRLAGNIATAFRELGEYGAALDALAGCDHSGHGVFLDEVRAQLALAEGRLEEARLLFAGSLSANLRPDGGVRKPEQYVDASVGLARTLLGQGRAADAVALLQEPLQRAEALDVPAHLGRVHGVLAEVHAALGDYRSAYEHARLEHQASVRLVNSRILDSVQTVRIEHAVAAARAEADRLRDLTRRDALTDLPNRRAIADRLAETERDPTDRPVVAVIDVDSFKQVNDRFTHVVGDQVLQNVARLLRTAVDKRHMVARLGGDEFVIVFESASEDEAMVLCEAARVSVATYPWHRICLGLAVTISIGAARATGGGQLGDIIGAADRRLLRAKRDGRNRLTT